MNKLLSAAVLAVALPEEITFTTFKPQEAMMEFLDAHWVEIFGMGALVLGVFNIGRANSAKNKADMTVAAIAGRDNWTEFHIKTVSNQILINTTLEQIGSGIGVIVCFLLILGIKLVL